MLYRFFYGFFRNRINNIYRLFELITDYFIF
nr:MAG TPA: hypothetical protein [Caudoviricetes sp.]